MLGELSSDIMGTSPKYPKIVDHEWLNVKEGEYDNIPTDNNPVRVLPDLAKQWGHDQNTGINLIPNLRDMVTGGSNKKAEETKADLMRTAKKALMMGLTGKKALDYLRGRFSSMDLEANKEELTKISAEQGLLGNVYVDSSAFVNGEDAVSFFRNNACRLAKYVLIKEGASNGPVMERIFKKKAVTSIDYNEDLLSDYKGHLVSARYIPSTYAVDSKESLRQAFLMSYKPEVIEAPKKKEAVIDQKKAVQQLVSQIEKTESANKEASEVIRFRTLKPIISCMQENLSKGKDVNGLKEILRARYSKDEINASADYLKLMVSKGGLNARNIDEMVTNNEIVACIAKEMLDIAKKFPIKNPTVPEYTPRKDLSGVRGYLYTPMKAPVAEDKWAAEKAHTEEALKKGFEPSAIKAKLMKLMSEDEANTILLNSISSVNASVGAVANRPAPKKKIIVEAKEKIIAEDPQKKYRENEEYVDFFKGAGDEIDINPAINIESSIDIEQGGLDGIDEALKA